MARTETQASGSTPANRASPLTAPGIGGVHLIQISGPGVEPFLKVHFRRRGLRGREPFFGDLVAGDELIDEVLVQEHEVGVAAVVDLGLHGSEAVRRRVKLLLQDAGFEWATDLHDAAMGLSSASAANAIEIEADVGMQASWAEQSTLFFAAVMAGGLRRECEGLLCDIGSLVSANESQPSALVHEVREGVATRLQSLCDRAPFGLAMTRAPVLAVIGPVNAGKSTLVNRLCGQERVIAGEEPGMTRDLVEAPIAIRGYPFRLVDTAGLRETQDAMERAGIARAVTLAKKAEIKLELADARDFFREDRLRSESLRPHADREVFGRQLRVFNKIDLLEPKEIRALRKDQADAVLVSAKTGEGFSKLEQWILFASAFRGPAVREFPTPFTSRQLRELEFARRKWPQDPAATLAALARLVQGDPNDQ
ncbi:MAG: GTP-binding protein [Planctomycetota bacterium]